MYVCVCNAVTESQILRAVKEGVRNLRGLQSHLGIALDCGRCARYAHGLLKSGRQTAKVQCNKDFGNCPCVMEQKQ